MLQLVSEQGQWIFDGEVPQSSFTISVFGSQNSGKSTLLNALFQTQFRQLDTKVTREQCTKGVWMQNRPPFNVIDTEGSDSLQRKDTLMEQFVALFAVSVSDIFIVNLWNHEVGRYYGSQFNVLKNVFRSSLKVKNSPRKLVLFVIKDTPADQQNKSVERTLNQDLTAIWGEVLSQQPDKAGSKLDRSFSFQFVFMSHYNRYRERYLGEAAQLRTLIDAKAKTLSKKPLRVSGAELTHYYRELWEKITSMEEIDIANERRLIIEYCCRRVKEECLVALQSILQKGSKFEKNYNTYVKKAHAITSSYYTYSTTQLDPEASQRILQELRVAVGSMVAQEFHEIQLRKADLISQTLEARLNQHLRRPDLLTRVKQGRQDALEQFKDFLLATPSAGLFMKDFTHRLDNALVKYQQHVNRQILAFESQFDETAKAWLEESVENLNFNPKTLETLFKQAVQAYGLNSTEYSGPAEYKKLAEKALNSHADEVLSSESKAVLAFHNPFGTQQTVVVHFRDRRKKMQGYLRSLQTFVQTQQLQVPSLDRIRNQTLRNIDEQHARQIDLNRRNRIVLPKPYFILLSVVAYSQFAAILHLVGMGQKLRVVLSFLYVLLAGLVFRSMI